MCNWVKRFLSASLAVVIICTTALTNAYAGTPSQAGDAWPSPPSGHPGDGPNMTPGGDHGGVRITVTNMSQAGESGIAPIELGANYTAAVDQFNELGNILTTKVWRPGNYGIKSNQARKGKFSFLAIPIFGDISFQVRAVKDKPCFFKILDSSHFLG